MLSVWVSAIVLSVVWQVKESRRQLVAVLALDLRCGRGQEVDVHRMMHTSRAEIAANVACHVRSWIA